MLILHLVCYLSGECSVKGLFLFSSVGYVSKSLIFILCLLFVCFPFVLFFQEKGDIWALACQCLNDQIIILAKLKRIIYMPF